MVGSELDRTWNALTQSRQGANRRGAPRHPLAGISGVQPLAILGGARGPAWSVRSAVCALFGQVGGNLALGRPMPAKYQSTTPCSHAIRRRSRHHSFSFRRGTPRLLGPLSSGSSGSLRCLRSEEHTSELQSL